jgi:hypothetical protein
MNLFQRLSEDSEGVVTLTQYGQEADRIGMVTRVW